MQPGLLGALNDFGQRYRKPIEAKDDEERARVEEQRLRISLTGAARNLRSRPGAGIRQRPLRGRLIRRPFCEHMKALPTEHCPNCGCELKIIVILEQPVIEMILTHLGLQTREPPRDPAHGQALQAA